MPNISTLSRYRGSPSRGEIMGTRLRSQEAVGDYKRRAWDVVEEDQK